jgi:hypothetical protein
LYGADLGRGGVVYHIAHFRGVERGGIGSDWVCFWARRSVFLGWIFVFHEGFKKRVKKSKMGVNNGLERVKLQNWSQKQMKMSLITRQENYF